jgi:hypothetical protein
MRRYSLGEYGAYGHSDPANGSYLLYANNTFTINGSGPVYRRDTSLHNVVTIDGQGQIGDSTVWLPDFFPPDILAKRPDVTVSGEWVGISVDLTSAYHRHLHLDRYVRAMHIVPDKYIVGVDLVHLHDNHSIEWNAHSWGAFELLAGQDPFVFQLPSHVRLVLYSPESGVVSSGPTAFVPAYPNDGRSDFQLTVGVRSTTALFVWCYVFHGEGVPRCTGRGLDVVSVDLDGHFSLTFDGRQLLPRTLA